MKICTLIFVLMEFPDKSPLGAIIFYENANRNIFRIKFEVFNDDKNTSAATLLVMLNVFQLIGLNDNEIQSLLQSKDAVKNVWNSSHGRRIMLAGADKNILLFASE